MIHGLVANHAYDLIFFPLAISSPWLHISECPLFFFPSLGLRVSCGFWSNLTGVPENVSRCESRLLPTNWHPIDLYPNSVCCVWPLPSLEFQKVPRGWLHMFCFCSATACGSYLVTSACATQPIKGEGRQGGATALSLKKGHSRFLPYKVLLRGST